MFSGASVSGEVEPETPEKTLDQWKKELEARKSKVYRSVRSAKGYIFFCLYSMLADDGGDVDSGQQTTWRCKRFRSTETITLTHGLCPYSINFFILKIAADDIQCGDTETERGWKLRSESKQPVFVCIIL